MQMHPIISDVTKKIIDRSKPDRDSYLSRMQEARGKGPQRAHLSCGNQAHAYAAAQQDQSTLATQVGPNIGIITAYNDMLSAHQPFETFPRFIRDVARENGGTAQVAGGVPAMCDGVTQGQPGMELSLFSRDVIALAAGIGLSHNTFDAAIYLGVCDKIVPGLIIAAATFGHLPSIFLPAGPMVSGIPNDEKAKIRQQFATGEVDRSALMKAEMASYHGPGTCTFYGTANSNQMLMEFMGLHLPGASFINPNTPLRDALTAYGTRQVMRCSALGGSYTPTCDILSEKAFVNGIVGLMATGGSTNLVLHLPAMARAAGIHLTIEDFDAISAITPLLAKVYPNGLADVNHFHAAGGLSFMIGELLNAGLLHEDVTTRNGQVFLADGLCDVIEADEHGFCPEVVDFDLHFFGVHAADFCLVDLVHIFNALLQDFRVILELVDGVIAGKVDLHDGHQLGEVEVEDVGVAGQVVRKAGIAHGDVHLVLDLSQRHFWGYREVEFDVNRAVSLLARRDDFIDAGDALDFLFDGAGDELFNVTGAVPWIGGAHKHLGNDHLREALFGNGDVGRYARDQNDRDQDRNSGAVFD